MINILPKQIAELISAGEVVERPVSVIKELVENSIDANAKRITVEIKHGGTSYMRITDDGSGILQDDVPKAFIRYATSKISTKKDLDKIMTLGFRGEALASVSAVSKIEMYTKTRNELYGTHYKIKGSQETLNEKTGCPEGTTIVVRDLFYNVPVRAKFMKRDVVEGNAISNIMKRLAVSHPEVAFTYIRDGRTEFNTFGDGEQYSAVYSVYGKTFAKDLTPVEHIEGDILVNGYTVKPLYAKSNRQYQIFFVNGRSVKSELLSTALEEAYSNTIMTNKFPTCILKLQVPPERVDVNIHPTKAEVRFSNENEVFNSVYFAVKNALMNSGLVYDFDLNKTKNSKLTQKTTPLETYVEPNLPNIDLPEPEEVINGSVEKNPYIFKGDDDTSALKEDIKSIENSSDDFIFNEDLDTVKPTTTDTIEPTTTEDTTSTYKPEISVDDCKPVKRLFVEEIVNTISTNSTIPNDSDNFERDNTKVTEPNTVPTITQEPKVLKKDRIGVVCKPKKPVFRGNLRLIGEAFKNYIVVEYNDDIIIIDKHAGHERIIYEKLKSQSTYTDRQILLDPIGVLLTEAQCSALESDTALSMSLGFQFGFSERPYVKVLSVPEILKLQDVESSVVEIANNILSHKKNPQTSLIDDIVHSLACKSAIKSNDITSNEELLSLAEQVVFNDKIRHCPHGRPVMFIMSKKDLERQFKRI